MHRVARDVEERLIAMAEVIPELDSDENSEQKANNASMGVSRQPLAA